MDSMDPLLTVPKNCARIDYQDVGHSIDGASNISMPITKCDPYYDEKTCRIICPIYMHINPVMEALKVGKYQLASIDPKLKEIFDDMQSRKQICPRKLLGCKSGEGLQYCNCNHAEQNAIAFAARNGQSTMGASAFVYPLSPCKPCAGTLISAGIKEIYCLEMNEYRDLAKIILDEAMVKLFLVKKELLDLDPSDSNIQTGSWVTSYK